MPCLLFARGVRSRNLNIIRTAAVVALLGIVLNRLNVSIIAFNWQSQNPYVPSWMELVITGAVISAEIWVFRWVVNRMPVFHEAPLWVVQEDQRAA